MNDLCIYLGNKNYSSWSLRAWLPFKQMGCRLGLAGPAGVGQGGGGGTLDNPRLRETESIVGDNAAR